MIHSRTRIFICLLSAAAGLGTLASCQPGAKVDSGTTYPLDLVQSETLDIHALRTDTTIELTNTSTRSFGPSTLWLNRQYSIPIDGLAIGQSLQLNLSDFRNEYSERFRAGGFFATEKPDTVVQVHIQTESEMVGLIAVIDRRDN